jgi:hypothetical protein
MQTNSQLDEVRKNIWLVDSKVAHNPIQLLHEETKFSFSVKINFLILLFVGLDCEFSQRVAPTF